MHSRVLGFDQLALALLQFERLVSKSAAQQVSQLRVYRARAHQRRQLAQLGETALRDMGISQAARAAELKKAFWEK